MKRRNFLKALGAIGLAATTPLVAKGDYFKEVEETIRGNAFEYDFDMPFFGLIDKDKNVVAKGMIQNIMYENNLIDISSGSEGYYQFARGRIDISVEGIGIEFPDFGKANEKFREGEELGLIMLFPKEQVEVASVCLITSMSLRVNPDEPIFHKMTLSINKNIKTQEHGKRRFFEAARRLGE